MIQRIPPIQRLFTFFLSISTVLLSGQSGAEAISLLGASPAQYCERWRDNGLIGARQQLRGASRQFEYVNIATLAELMEHGLDGKKLFALASDYSPPERRFLEESTLGGYDRMAAFRIEHPDGGDNYESLKQELYEDCLSGSRHASRTDQAERTSEAPAAHQ